MGEQESGHSGQEGSLDTKIMSSHIYSGQLDNILEIKITDTIADKRNDMKENDEWKDSDVHDWTTSDYGSSMIKQSRDMIDNDESIERHTTREIQI